MPVKGPEQASVFSLLVKDLEYDHDPIKIAAFLPELIGRENFHAIKRAYFAILRKTHCC